MPQAKPLNTCDDLKKELKKQIKLSKKPGLSKTDKKTAKEAAIALKDQIIEECKGGKGKVVPKH